MNKIIKYAGIGGAALALYLLAAAGCALAPKKEHTPEERARAYFNLCESCKDGVSALEARDAASMYFDPSISSIDAKAKELPGALPPKDNLIKKINQFYESDGKIIAYIQRKEGEGRNAKIQSLGGRRAVHTGITLREFKAFVEGHYKGNQAKIDEVLIGLARVSWDEYGPIARRGRRFDNEDWNARLVEIEIPLFKKVLASKGGRFGPENDPANQIKEGDGNFVLSAISAIIPEKK